MADDPAFDGEDVWVKANHYHMVPLLFRRYCEHLICRCEERICERRGNLEASDIFAGDEIATLSLAMTGEKDSYSDRFGAILQKSVKQA